MKNSLSYWRDPAILLTSLGIAHIGNFVYLVAINIIVFQMTGSATAVAILWLIGPMVNILIKFFTGSYIDFRSKKKIMMQTYILRGILIMFIPFAPNVVVIYILLIFLSVANAFFVPSSITYTTILVPIDMRKRFNSIRSFTSSLAFIIGPSIGGTLILLTTVDLTLWINGIFFIGSALLLSLLPSKEAIDKNSIPAMNLAQLKLDFSVVVQFFKSNQYVTLIYFGFILIMVATFAMDAQEVVFTQQVVGLSEFEYSLLISITGIGSVTGGIVLSTFSSYFSLRSMIVIGLGL